MIYLPVQEGKERQHSDNPRCYFLLMAQLDAYLQKPHLEKVSYCLNKGHCQISGIKG